MRMWLSSRVVALVWLLLSAHALVWGGAFAEEGDSVSTGSRTSSASEGTRESRSPTVQRFEQNGLAVELAIHPLDPTQVREDLFVGQSAMVNVALTDAKTGAPVLGIRPRAWITGRPSEMVASETACADKIRPLVSGRLGTRAEMDLNQYVVLTMNHDKTISVINPQVDFSITKLESLVTLPGVGADWVLNQDGNILYVTIPDESAVAVIDTRTRRLIHTVTTGPGSRPGRILLQPDGRQAWVGLDGTAQVALLDTATHHLAATVPIGQGLHALAATADSRFIYVTNSKSNTVSAIDTQTHSVATTIPVGDTPVTLTYSSVARRFYVGALNGNAITAIDPTKHRVVSTIPVTPGIVALATEPQGRFVVAANQLESRISLIDTATNAVTVTAPVVKEPDQVAFTEHYAYIRGIESEKVTLLDLGSLRRGKVTPLDIQIGRKAPSAAAEELGVASMIAPTPEGNAVMVANAPDATLYFYQEGMMAPMGTFSNYKRMPRGILVLDRSLREVSPGVYRAPITLTKAGRFDVPVLIDQPRVVHCFQVAVQESPEQIAVASRNRPPLVRPLFGKESISAHAPTALQFTLLDAATQQPVAGVKDMQVLLFEPPGTWQQRHWATEVEAGRYAVTQSFPHAGEYRVMIQSPSQHLRFVDATSMVLTVVPSSKGSSSAAKTSHNR